MFPPAFILSVFLEGSLLNIFQREIQTASKLDNSCSKLIITNYYFMVFEQLLLWSPIAPGIAQT